MKYKAILFDVDDTLCKTAGTKGLIFDTIYKNHKIFQKHTLHKFRKILTDSRHNYFDKLISKGFNTYARIEFWFEVMKKLSLKISVTELMEIVEEYWELSYENITPYPKLRETLAHLNNMPNLIIATLTAGDYYSKTQKLVKLGIEKFFDYNFTTELVQKPKINTGIYKYVANYLDLEPKEIVMVGDKPHEDIAPANKVGMVTVQAMMRGDYEAAAKGESKPDFVIDNLPELVDLFT